MKNFKIPLKFGVYYFVVNHAKVFEWSNSTKQDMWFLSMLHLRSSENFCKAVRQLWPDLNRIGNS